ETSRSVEHRAGNRIRLTGVSPDGRWYLIEDKMPRADEHEDKLDLWLVPVDGASPAVQLTDGPGNDINGTFSLDGRAVYFVSDRGGTPNIWKIRLDPDTGQRTSEPTQATFYRDTRLRFPRMLATGEMAFVMVNTTNAIHVAPPDAPDESRVLARGLGPQVSPDGQTIYFVGEGPEQVGIFAIGRDGGTPRQLTRTRPATDYLRLFDISPDGRHLAYFSREDRTSRLHVVPTGGGEERTLVEVESGEEITPAWSPDGTMIAYAIGSDLYVISAGGGEPRVLAKLLRWEEWSPRWSPDGAFIAAFGYARAGEQNAVFVVPAAGGEPRRMTPPEEGSYKEGLEWHPDGTRLTYMYYGTNGTRQAFLDGRPTELLVDQPSPAWDYIGRWSPDGSTYVFTSVMVARGNWGLYAYDDRTAEVRVLSPPEAGNADVPSWSRDGKTMTWSRGRTTVQLWTVADFQ
ncbi:MAG: TolB family protein, partial [Planctomycetota bacterium]